MALLRYLKPVKSHLPDPNGPLSADIPPTAIRQANLEVLSVENSKRQDPSTKTRTQGPYGRLTDEQRAQIGKYVSENGNAAAVRKFSKELDRPLNKSTVRSIKKNYYQELGKKRSPSGNLDSEAITSLPPKKRGRPLLLGETIDSHVQSYIKVLRANGAPVTTSIAIATATGIVSKTKRTSLQEYGGPVALTKSWAQSLLRRMGFVKRKGGTKTRILPMNLDELRTTFLEQIQINVDSEEIPPQLVLNWDHTALSYVPASKWTMEKKGTKKIEIGGLNDKRQITGLFAATMSGDFLPIQLVYQGKTKRSHPDYPFPSDWHITHTSTHWSNEETMLEYIDKIIVPYVEDKKKELGLPEDHHALVIYDEFRGQITEDVMAELRQHHFDVVLVPPNCTDCLQPLDVSVNKAAKDFLKSKFREWYATQILQQLEKGASVDELQPVDMQLSTMKSLCAQWIVAMFDYFKSHPDIIINGFKGAGIAY